MRDEAAGVLAMRGRPRPRAEPESNHRDAMRCTVAALCALWCLAAACADPVTALLAASGDTSGAEAVSECQRCADGGDCSLAFRGRPGQFCGSWIDRAGTRRLAAARSTPHAGSPHTTADAPPPRTRTVLSHPRATSTGCGGCSERSSCASAAARAASSRSMVFAAAVSSATSPKPSRWTAARRTPVGIRSRACLLSTHRRIQVATGRLAEWRIWAREQAPRSEGPQG